MKTLLSIGITGNLIDTIATLILYYKYGYTEANPIMAKLLEMPFVFAIIKILAITFIAIWLWRNKDNKYAKIASCILAIVYGAIAVYYAIFFTVI